MTEYTPEQVQENRRKWLEALRSGKFKQTKGKLKSRNGSYCCLGVLCEVAGIPKRFNGTDYTYGEGKGWSDSSETALPTAAQEWLGVSDSAPHLATPVAVKDKDGDSHPETNLIELNDTYGWSFEQIADAVEKNGLREV